MPNFTQTLRNKRYFRILLTTVIAGLGLPSVIDWTTEGEGQSLLLLARIDDDIQPAPHGEIVSERWIITPFPDIYAAWFTAYPASTFRKLTISFDSTYMYFHLNREES